MSLRRLPTAQRPPFSDRGWFWIIPSMGCLICLIGFGTALQHSLVWPLLTLVILVILMTLIWRHDQYSAVIRILFDDYTRLQRENPGSTDFDILYSIVKSRRPLWTEDRILEFCVGKSINQVVLLMLIMEYEIHPISDMNLYQRLKVQVETMGGKLKKSQPDHQPR